MRPRGSVPPEARRVQVGRGEKVLAGAMTGTGEVVVGTRLALYLPGAPVRRIPWEQVHRADWSPDDQRFRVSEVGDWGEDRPVHEWTIAEPGLLLELVRERVTATVVLQRHVAVQGGRGFFVVARRPASGRGGLAWLVEFEEGLDPAAPGLAQEVEQALARARAEVDLG